MKNHYLKNVSASLLLMTAIVFSGNTLFAQDVSKKEKKSKSSSEKSENKKHIVIIKEENGKTTKIDTVIHGDSDVIIGKDMDFDFDFNFDFPGLAELPDLPELPDMQIFSDSGSHYAYKYKFKMDEKEKEKLKEEMERAKEEMKKANEEMKKLNREELEKQMEKLREEMLKLKMEMKEKHKLMWNDEKGEGKKMMYRFNSGDKEEAGAMKKCIMIIDGDTIVSTSPSHCRMMKIKCEGKVGDKVIIKDETGDIKIEKEIEKNENASEPSSVVALTEPAAVEAISPEITERSASPAGTSGDRKIIINDLNFFPNPTNGQFSLSFRLDTPGSAEIRLLDAGGNEIMNETYSGFPGTYSKQFDISGKAKGTYLLMITQGDKWHHEKLVLK